VAEASSPDEQPMAIVETRRTAKPSPERVGEVILTTLGRPAARHDESSMKRRAEPGAIPTLE
jgi:hypothetical protein